MADTIYLVRHAAPPAAARGRYWGVKDPGIDPAGLADAAGLAALVRERPVRVVSSPLARCVRTAETLAGALHSPVEYDPQVAEVDFGIADGLTFAELERDHPECATEWAAQGDHFTFPGGESIPDFFHRTVAAWKYWRDVPDTTILVCSHAGVLSGWMCLFLGLPLSRRLTFAPAYAALTKFVRKKDGSGWNLAYFNHRGI